VKKVTGLRVLVDSVTIKSHRVLELCVNNMSLIVGPQFGCGGDFGLKKRLKEGRILILTRFHSKRVDRSLGDTYRLIGTNHSVGEFVVNIVDGRHSCSYISCIVICNIIFLDMFTKYCQKSLFEILQAWSLLQLMLWGG